MELSDEFIALVIRTFMIVEMPSCAFGMQMAGRT